MSFVDAVSSVAEIAAAAVVLACQPLEERCSKTLQNGSGVGRKERKKRKKEEARKKPRELLLAAVKGLPVVKASQKLDDLS